MEVKCCLDAYLEFDKEKESKQFTIIDGLQKIETGSNNDSMLLILDSSFNPPHWGHYTLIKKAYEHYHQLYPTKKFDVLLLLSVQNADKGVKPATFDKRVEMMCIMARLLTQELSNLSCSVGLTIFGKFIDKDEVIRNRFFSNGDIVYLVGFDTITRIFDPKYYVPQSPVEALGEFMQNTKFCCLTRHDDDEENEDSTSYNEQLNYSSKISNGDYEPLIPKEWGNKISVLLNDPKYANVSSSAIRKIMMGINGQTSNESIDFASLETQLPKEIIQYIIKQSELKSIFT